MLFPPSWQLEEPESLCINAVYTHKVSNWFSHVIIHNCSTLSVRKKCQGATYQNVLRAQEKKNHLRTFCSMTHHEMYVRFFLGFFWGGGGCNGQLSFIFIKCKITNKADMSFVYVTCYASSVGQAHDPPWCVWGRVHKSHLLCLPYQCAQIKSIHA